MPDQSFTLSRCLALANSLRGGARPLREAPPPARGRRRLAGARGDRGVCACGGRPPRGRSDLPRARIERSTGQSGEGLARRGALGCICNCVAVTLGLVIAAAPRSSHAEDPRRRPLRRRPRRAPRGRPRAARRCASCRGRRRATRTSWARSEFGKGCASTIPIASRPSSAPRPSRSRSRRRTSISAARSPSVRPTACSTGPRCISRSRSRASLRRC